MNQQEKKPIMINRLHLIYLSIISISVIIFVITLDHGGSSKAGEMLSFAATLSSIILSVIAIIMTIVDVAGQRNTVVELKETAEKLNENLVNANQSISEVNNLKDELLNSMESILKSNSTVKEEITGLKEKYSKKITDGQETDKTDLHENIVNDLSNLSSKLDSFQLKPVFTPSQYISELRKKNKLIVMLPDDYNQDLLNNLINELMSFLEISAFDYSVNKRKLYIYIYKLIPDNTLKELNNIFSKYGCTLVGISN